MPFYRIPRYHMTSTRSVGNVTVFDLSHHPAYGSGTTGTSRLVASRMGRSRSPQPRKPTDERGESRSLDAEPNRPATTTPTVGWSTCSARASSPPSHGTRGIVHVTMQPRHLHGHRRSRRRTRATANDRVRLKSADGGTRQLTGDGVTGAALPRHRLRRHRTGQEQTRGSPWDAKTWHEPSLR